MRLLPLTLFAIAGLLAASEPPAYPLWDGSESVADYAKRVNLPATKTLDLGNGVTMELVLIPAGKFIMGTPEPTPVDEAGFQKKILTGQLLLAVSGIALLVMLVVVIGRAVRKRQRPKYSLLWLLAMTVATGGCVLSGLHWRESARGLQVARVEYPLAKARYDAAENSEKPAHQVTLTQPIYMGKFTVTQNQYQAVTGKNPSHFTGKENPVEQVSWDDAQAFTKKLTEQTRQAVRLPTEAEWEYSCRAGTTTTYYSGDTEADLARAGWYYIISKETSHPVGQKDANAFGLYDMLGNVWQWTQDWYTEDYCKRPMCEIDPQGPSHGYARVERGGSWRCGYTVCRAAYRAASNPPQVRHDGGFRVVSPISTPP